MKMIIELSEEDYLDILYYCVDKDQCFAYSDFHLREIIRNGTVVSEYSDGSLITLEGKRVIKRMEVNNDTMITFILVLSFINSVISLLGFGLMIDILDKIERKY